MNDESINVFAEEKRKIPRALDITIKVVCVILIILSLVTMLFTGDIILNKSVKATYSELKPTDTMMLKALSEYILADTNRATRFKSTPIILLRDDGVFRGHGFLFNHPITESKTSFGLNAGTFTSEILLPTELQLGTVYRTSIFMPETGSVIFPTNFKFVTLCGLRTMVITYNAESLENGEFLLLLRTKIAA